MSRRGLVRIGRDTRTQNQVCRRPTQAAARCIVAGLTRGTLFELPDMSAGACQTISANGSLDCPIPPVKLPHVDAMYPSYVRFTCLSIHRPGP